MLHIILGILKILGFIIVTIIAILLLVLLLILFFPVTYQMKGEKNENIIAKGKASWLFPFVIFYITYENNMVSTKLKIFGIPIRFDKTKKEKRKKTKRKKTKRKKEKIDNGNLIPDQSILTGKEKENDKTNNKSVIDEKPKNDEIQEIEKVNKPINKESRIINLIKKIRRRIKAICSGIKNIKFTLNRIYDRMVKVKGSVSEIIEFLKDTNNKAGFQTIKKQFLRLWKHIRPKRYDLYMKFGTGDPAATGQLLGVMSLTYPIFKNHMNIIPDFENQIFEGNLFLKGRIQIYMLVWIAICLYRDKNLKSMIYQLQKIRRK